MSKLNASITWNEQKQRIEYEKSKIDLGELIHERGMYPSKSSTSTLCSIQLRKNTLKENEKIINLCLEKGNMDNTARCNFLMGLLSANYIGISYIREKLPKELFEDKIKELKENKNISFFVKLCLAILGKEASISDTKLITETPMLLHAILLALGLSKNEFPKNYSQKDIGKSNIEFTMDFGNPQSRLSFYFNGEQHIDFQETVLSKIKELLREETCEHYLNWSKDSDSYHSLSTEQQLKTKTCLNKALADNKIVQIKPAYLIVMDCSLDKKGNMIIFECQSAKHSSLYEVSDEEKEEQQKLADIDDAFGKAFSDINIQYADKRHAIVVNNSSSKILFFHHKYKHLLEQLEQDPQITQVYNLDSYGYKKIKSKIVPRLFLPAEVNPRYYILEIQNKTLEKLADEVKVFCEKNNIKDIVIKDPCSSDGKSNYFIDVTEKKIEKEIADIMLVEKFDYLLIEEQKIFPSISRKTGVQKDYFRTYRMISLLTEEGCLGRFILSKNRSGEIDSHKRYLLKCYINPIAGAPDVDGVEYVGTKDKYYGLGDNAININQEILQKVDKSLFTLLSATEEEIIEQLSSKIKQQDLQCKKSKETLPESCVFNNKKPQANTALSITDESSNTQIKRCK